jgi:two-component system LytT family response regulator
MVKCAIVDDEERARELLVHLLKAHCPQVQVAFTAKSPSEALRLIQNEEVDILFLDVEMEGTTGFDLLEQLEEINFDIVFTTAHSEYAIQAIRFSAIDYLLKPIDPEELIAAVEKSSSRKPTRKSETSTEQIKLLMQMIKHQDTVPNRITVPTLDGFIFLNVADIVHCLGETNYTNIFLNNGQKFLSSKSLKVYEELLSPYNFYRIHKSHLINLSYLKKYIKGDGGRVIMNDGTELEVSRRKKEEFLVKIGR